MPTSHDCGFFFFNDTATTEIYTLSLHDALPILPARVRGRADQDPVSNDDGRASGPDELGFVRVPRARRQRREGDRVDRKSKRLNSSHSQISYAVFCLKK